MSDFSFLCELTLQYEACRMFRTNLVCVVPYISDALVISIYRYQRYCLILYCLSKYIDIPCKVSSPMRYPKICIKIGGWKHREQKENTKHICIALWMKHLWRQWCMKSSLKLMSSCTVVDDISWLECFQSVVRSDARERSRFAQVCWWETCVCCSGLVDILLTSWILSKKHVAVRSDKSRIGMRAVCRVTLDTPSPSLASECERVTAGERPFSGRLKRVCFKVYGYDYLKNKMKSTVLSFFLFFSLTLWLFYSGLTKVMQLCFSFFPLRAHTPSVSPHSAGVICSCQG